MNISKCLYPLYADLYVVFKNIYNFKNWSMETSTISSQSQRPGQYLIAVKTNHCYKLRFQNAPYIGRIAISSIFLRIYI